MQLHVAAVVFAAAVVLLIASGVSVVNVLLVLVTFANFAGTWSLWRANPTNARGDR